MIQSFGDETTVDLFRERNTRAARRIPRELWRVTQRKLKALDVAIRLEDLTIPSGNRLESLRGTRSVDTAFGSTISIASPSDGSRAMRTKSASKTITRDLRSFGPAIPPGEMLLEEFLKPMGIGQVAAARRLAISLNRLNEIVLGQARHYRRHGVAPRALVEDLGAVLDALASGLGSA